MKLLLYHYLSSDDRWMMNTTKSILGRVSSFSTGNGRVFASLLYDKNRHVVSSTDSTGLLLKKICFVHPHLMQGQITKHMLKKLLMSL